MRLGELLVRRGLIGAQQLEEALGAQLIYGGHLGTCLIELGYLEEADLGPVLAEVSGVACASREQLGSATSHVISLLPEPLVRKYCAVPFQLRGQRLDVAMISPSNLHALDEISFAAGCKIDPWIAPEVRLYQAMEQYYDIPRRQRYVALCRQLDRDDSSMRPAVFGPMAPLGEPEIDLGASSARSAERGWGASSAAATLEENQVGDQAAPIGELEGRFCAAESWDELAQLVLEHTVGSLAHCILFRVRGGSAFVWRSRGIPEPEKIEGLQFPLVSGSVLGLVRGAELFRGGVPADENYLEFYRDLGMAAPREVMILPLYAADRLIGLFYGDSGELEEIAGSTEEFRRLTRKFSLGLDLVRMKREIRSA